MQEATRLNGYKIYPFRNREGLLNFLGGSHLNKMLFALDAVTLGKKDRALKKLVDDNSGYPGGAGMALKHKKIFTEQKANEELWLDIIQKFYRDKTFYLAGGKQEILEIAVLKLQQEFPGIRILNVRSGEMDFFERNELMDDVAAKKPDIIFMEAGNPKQEFLMQDLLEEHEALYMALENGFAPFAGVREQLPEGYQSYGVG